MTKEIQMASKALKEGIQIRVSKPMANTLDKLAELHGVKTSRLIRAILWMFLHGERPVLDSEGNMVLVEDRRGKLVLKKESLHRESGLLMFAREDDELIEMLKFVDTFDAGGTVHDMTDQGPFLEDEDDGDPIG
jgi:hypothetical protein